MPYAILTVILVVLDQIVKHLVLQNIALGEHVPFIPYILDLTYVQNTGAAYSMFNQHTWILTLISAVMSVVLAVAIRKNFFRHPLGKLCLTLILGGAIGNFIDRLRLGYVIDMFDFCLINFAVFNFADICITIGGAIFVLLTFLDYKAEVEAEKAAKLAETQQKEEEQA